MKNEPNIQVPENVSGSPAGDQSRSIVIPAELRTEILGALEDAERALDAFAAATTIEANSLLCKRRSQVTNEDRRWLESAAPDKAACDKFTNRCQITVSALLHMSDAPEQVWQPINGLCRNSADQLDDAIEALEKLAA